MPRLRGAFGVSGPVHLSLVSAAILAVILRLSLAILYHWWVESPGALPPLLLICDP
jgi:hypothetical protein